MSIAVMQPYIFPYLGYFQLIDAVDTFVFYDDVHFIKRGWINRNKILVNGAEFLFSIPVVKASQNKLINEIEVNITPKWLQQFYATLTQNYKNAPYFEDVFQLIKKVFSKEYSSISDLAIESVVQISNYLELPTRFEISSERYGASIGMDKADRLISICKKKGSDTYINPSGGKELYYKDYFESKGISLSFIENDLVPYTQFSGDFVQGLSIIDVLMFNSNEATRRLIDNYQFN